MRISRQLVVFTGVALTVSVACSEPSSTNRTTLPLRSVDGTAVPVTLPSGVSGTVVVTGGTVEGSSNGSSCSYSITREGSAELSIGTSSPCTVVPGSQITLSLNLGGPPWPSGFHDYHFN
jgi:hypothetical protein